MEQEPLNIYQAIPKIMAEVGHIGKDQKNTHQGWKFRGIDDVYNALNKLMAKYGVFTTCDIVENEREKMVSQRGTPQVGVRNKYRYTFYATDGSSVYCEAIGEAIDQGDKANNKAMSIAHKYVLFQVFCIPTEESQDPDFDAQSVAYSKKDIARDNFSNAHEKLIGKLSEKQLEWINRHDITVAEIDAALNKVLTSIKQETAIKTVSESTFIPEV